eukprot:7228272-Pyramimonas_sp.AAC.1
MSSPQSFSAAEALVAYSRTSSSALSARARCSCHRCSTWRHEHAWTNQTQEARVYSHNGPIVAAGPRVLRPEPPSAESLADHL